MTVKQGRSDIWSDWWIVYLVTNDLSSLLFHNIPNEWIVSFAGQSGQDYYEIDFIGPTRDRLLVRTILEQNLDDLKGRNVISNYVIRATYVPATDRDTTYETYYHMSTNPSNRMFCL